MEQKTVSKIKKSETEILKDLIIDSILDKKGEGITIIDLRKISEAISDYFIICHADNTPQVRAISENIASRVKQDLGESPLHIEGMNNLEWVLIDYFNILVHVFYKEKREFYNIEDLWSDGEIQYL